MLTKNRWKQAALLLALSLLLSACGTEPAETTAVTETAETIAATEAAETTVPETEAPALNGWVSENGADRYYVKGSFVTGLYRISGILHYFDEDGSLCTGKVMVDGSLYIFGPDGRAVDGWYELDGSKYHCAKGKALCRDSLSFDSGYYEFGADGALAHIVYSEPKVSKMPEQLFFPNCANTLVPADGFLLEEPIRNCLSLEISSMCFSYDSIAPDGIWMLMLRVDGEWVPAAAYSLDRGFGSTVARFDAPVCFDAYAVFRNSAGEINPEVEHDLTYVTTQYRTDDSESDYKPTVPRNSVWTVVLSTKIAVNEETGRTHRTGVFTALDGTGQVLWTYTTDPHDNGEQYIRFGIVLLDGDRFFFYDRQNLICMNANTGAVLWKNKEFDAAGGAHGVLGENGNLYVCCSAFPYFFAADPYGGTLYREEDFGDYIWPYDIRMEDSMIAVYFEAGPEGVSKHDCILYIDPNTFEYTPKLPAAE